MVVSWLHIYTIVSACIVIEWSAEGFSRINVMNGVRNMAFTNCQFSRLIGEQDVREGIDLECSKGVNEIDSSRLRVSRKKTNDMLLQEPHGGKLVNLMVQSDTEKKVRGSVVIIVALGLSSSAMWTVIT